MENEDWLRRLPTQQCPNCGCTLNAIVEREAAVPAEPREDDLTMCFECFTALMFNKDLSLRLLNAFEKKALDEIIQEITNELLFLKRGKA